MHAFVINGSNCGEVFEEVALFKTLDNNNNNNMMIEEETNGVVEEGEISDETLTSEEEEEEDFNLIKEESSEVKNVISDSILPIAATVAANANNDNNNDKTTRNGWTVHDMYNKYGGQRYGGRSNVFAWAQAVSNKPLNEFLLVDDKQLASASSANDIVIAIDDDDDNEMMMVKEEGELEEGEIHMDSHSDRETSLDDHFDFEKRINLIRESFGSVTADNVKKSFHDVCSQLLTNFESLRELVLPLNNVGTKDALVQLGFGAIKIVFSVFCSMDSNLKEQNKETLSRLTTFMKSHDPSLFSPEQIEEVQQFANNGIVKPSSLRLQMETMSAKSDQNSKAVSFANEVNQQQESNNLAKSAALDRKPANNSVLKVENLVLDKPNMPLESAKPEVLGLRSRGVALPLLDLHKDHDEDSLPSPTRSMPCLPVQNSFHVANSGLSTSKLPQEKDTGLPPYETDVAKAVSTYQQKFVRSSFFTSLNLPSPTPSEESDNGDSDIGAEVSSSSNVGNTKPIYSIPIVGSSSTKVSTVQGPNYSHGAPTQPSKSAKPKDPRLLRFANSARSSLDLKQQKTVEPIGVPKNSRKQKNVDDSISEGPMLKKQKNGLENHGFVKTSSGNDGWLEDTVMTGPNNLNKNPVSNPSKCNNGVSSTIVGNNSIPPNGTNSAPPSAMGANGLVPPTWNDLAVNPTILLNILNMTQQQMLATDGQQKPTDPTVNTSQALTTNSQAPTTNSIIGTVSSVNTAPTNPSGILPRPNGATSQMSAKDELGKPHMKARDPRRVLHKNTLQKVGSLGSEQIRTNGLPTSNMQKDNPIAQKQDLLAGTKPSPSQSIRPPPDITSQFTKSLTKIADMVSPQSFSNQPVVPQSVPAQPALVKSDRIDLKDENLSSEEKQTAPSLIDTASAPSSPQSSWVGVEHLFEGYDEKQKVAIQRERARRMEEQKKMFGARKLCLVLDLDHTLLNSAKFGEVDHVHDEILRKKEVLDRENGNRHLFCLPHMAMWTKLRPGVWTFLERASKLYELHLYTMGNKLYATEMAKILDPKGTLFNGRVIAKGDDGDSVDGEPKTKDLEGVLGMESAVVIIDDSVRVWPHNKLNLIAVERYIYFPCSRRQFGLLGPSLLEIDVDERPEDGTLASSLAVIERIHQNFFSHQNLDDVDVRNILASEQQKILVGCRIVFSRVFPVGDANPHMHPLWQTAEQFGATCTNQIDDRVTHVVAHSLGTDKVNWAFSTGKFVVYPGWVEASALLYRRANEHDFGIKS